MTMHDPSRGEGRPGLPDAPSSSAHPGHDRREAILAFLLDAQGRHTQARRRRRRVMATSATVLMAAAMVWIGLVSSPAGPARPSGAQVAEDGERHAPSPHDLSDTALAAEHPAPAAPPSRLVIHHGDDKSPSLVLRVGSDPAVLERLRLRGTGRVRILDDAALMRALAEAGHPTGLISVAGRTSLATPVVDDVPNEDDGARHETIGRWVWARALAAR